MPLIPRTPTVLACALVAGLALAAPAEAELLYGRLETATGQASDTSQSVDVSNNGKVWVFSSGANNWVTGLPPGEYAVAIDGPSYLAEDPASIEVVSRMTDGTPVRGIYPAVSRDGRYVAFSSNHGSYNGIAAPNWQVLRKDRVTGTLAIASSNLAGEPGTAHNDDGNVAISGDGRYVAFASSSTNYGVTPPDTWYQIWVKDLQTGTIELASVNPSGAPVEDGCTLSANAMSDNGRYLTFVCANELITGVGSMQTYVRDLQANTTELISRATGANGAPSTAFTGEPSISADGRFVTFRAPQYSGLGGTADAHSGVYLRDRATATTVSIPRPALSAGGGCATSAVSNAASVLLECTVGSSSQVFLFVLGSGAPLLVSSNAAEQPGNGASGYSVAVDASGLSMAFESVASDLVPNDTNVRSDIFVLFERSVMDGIFGDGFED